MNSRTFAHSAAFCLTTFLSVSHGQVPITVTVEVTSGRRWEGIIDTKSTDEELVLRFEKGSAVLWRPIAWQDVLSAKIDGKSLPVVQLKTTFRPMATSAKSKTERAKLNPPNDPFPSDPQPGLPQEQPEEKPPLVPQRVTYISCDALLANWDADVEADGLIIHLQPVDQFQDLAVAAGTLEVELFTLQARAFHHAPNSRGRSVEPIVYWAQSVNVSDYTNRGAAIRLPFQAAHPEFDDSLGAYGLVHIKFSVPGSGVFEQTIDGVRIRPWSPLRDYLQMDTGRRFLPHETTGRGKTSWFTDDR
jgi:hypothetical protein